MHIEMVVVGSAAPLTFWPFSLVPLVQHTSFRLLGKRDRHHPRVNHHDGAARNGMIEETPTDKL